MPKASVNVTHAEQRVRRSRGSPDVHTAHSQPMTGTPAEVPEPRMIRRGWLITGAKRTGARRWGTHFYHFD